MALNAIEICSNALVLLGDEAISSFEDGTTGSIVAGQLYRVGRDQAMGKRQWHFTKHQAQLSRILTVPNARWDAAYTLPVDCDRVKAVLVNDVSIPFDIHDARYVLCNASESDVVYLEYFRTNDPAYWPIYFRVYVEAVLASIFAIPVTGRDELSKLWSNNAQALYLDARQADGGGRTADRMPISRMIAARTSVG